jgi:general transcription factor 3C polypeptide 5 (transcription factor C subunit 1)
MSDGKLKDYKLDTAAGADKSRDVAPSALFVQMPIAYDYKFRQNTHVEFAGREGEIGIQRILAYNNYSVITPDAQTVPQGPSPDLPPESKLTPYVQSLIASIRLELQKRPIITRHLLYNTLGWDRRDRLRYACVYCGYFFETGPWREALITWGVDPRTNPSFRKYQTVSFLSYKKTGTARHHTSFDRHVQTLARTDTASLRNQHIFDGVNVSWTGNLFQFCDITDPFIRQILDTDDIRDTCAPTLQGWYHIGTWAKATIILKDKMNRILGGEQPDNSLYARILTWPEIWDDQEMRAQYRPEFWNKQLHKEKEKEHAVMRHVWWAARNPRYAFERMEKAGVQRSEQPEEENPEEEADIPVDMTEEPDTAKNILEEGDDEEDEDEAAEDEDEDEEGDGGLSEDVDAEGETDDELISYRQREGSRESDGLEQPAPPDTVGPLPFGGLYRS